jgi:hypothetical protein
MREKKITYGPRIRKTRITYRMCVGKYLGKVHLDDPEGDAGITLRLVLSLRIWCERKYFRIVPNGKLVC